MKNLIWIVVLNLALISTLFAQNNVRLYGHVTDFNNNPIDSVSIRLKQSIDSLKLEDKNKIFENSYETLTDSNGYFSLDVKPGTYYCLYAIKESDYGKTKLEYWAWNVPIYDDLEINPQYERMEIYGVSAFEPKKTPFNTYMIFFRPMSLTKALALPKEAQPGTIDIAPQNISKEELTVKINGIETEVMTINKIKEYIGNESFMYSYMIQVLKDDGKSKKNIDTQTVEGYNKISITLHSGETNEYGKGEYFIKRIGK